MEKWIGSDLHQIPSDPHSFLIHLLTERKNLSKYLFCLHGKLNPRLKKYFHDQQYSLAFSQGLFEFVYRQTATTINTSTNGQKDVAECKELLAQINKEEHVKMLALMVCKILWCLADYSTSEEVKQDPMLALIGTKGGQTAAKSDSANMDLLDIPSDSEVFMA